MDRRAFQSMIEQDEVHWWYVARRRVLASAIARMVDPRPDARILEVGCGTGHNLPMLSRFGRVEASEIDPVANEVAAKRLGRPISDARLPELDGIDRRTFDLVVSLDVLEHVEDDESALRAILSCAKHDGKVLVTVPAFQFLWSEHDVSLHHYRRYAKSEIEGLVNRAGGTCLSVSYFNSLLFPVAVARRFANKLQNSSGTDDAIPGWGLNTLFQKVFAFERHFVGRLPFPPGLSLMVLCTPSGQTAQAPSRP